MSASTRLTDILRRYYGDPDYGKISEDLNEAFAAGQEFGLLRVIDAMDNYGIDSGAMQRLQALKVECEREVRVSPHAAKRHKTSISGSP